MDTAWPPAILAFSVQIEQFLIQFQRIFNANARHFFYNLIRVRAPYTDTSSATVVCVDTKQPFYNGELGLISDSNHVIPLYAYDATIIIITPGIFQIFKAFLFKEFFAVYAEQLNNRGVRIPAVVNYNQLLI